MASLSGKGETLQLLTLLDDFLHLSFQLIQILPGKGSCSKIIIKPVSILLGPIASLASREHMLHRLRKHMGSRMADHSQPFLIPGRQDRQLAIPVKHHAQIPPPSRSPAPRRPPLPGPSLISAAISIILCSPHIPFTEPSF